MVLLQFLSLGWFIAHGCGGRDGGDQNLAELLLVLETRLLDPITCHQLLLRSRRPSNLRLLLEVRFQSRGGRRVARLIYRRSYLFTRQALE